MTSNKQSVEQIIFQTIYNKYPEAFDIEINGVYTDFLDGRLYYVILKKTKQEDAYNTDFNYVYLRDEEVLTFDSNNELLVSISESKIGNSGYEKYIKNTNLLGDITELIKEIFRNEGVSGLIGLILTITIANMANKGQDIPDILSNALAAIIGYYFGSKKSK